MVLLDDHGLLGQSSEPDQYILPVCFVVLSNPIDALGLLLDLWSRISSEGMLVQGLQPKSITCKLSVLPAVLSLAIELKEIFNSE